MKDNNLPVKALLLLDNAPAHPDAPSLVSSDRNIKAMFLPANTTALIQPMDQGVLEAVKRRYRRALLQRLLLEDEEGRSITEFCKKINIKDVVYMSAAAWDDISPVTLTRSWRKLLQIKGHSTALSTDQELDDTSVSSNCETLLRKLDSNLDNSDTVISAIG